MSEFDVAVIGAGHNGLIAACYLARTGLDVAVFEENAQPGGGLYTESFTDHPDFLRNNHAINLMNVRNAPFHRDLRLERYGAQLIDPPAKVGLPTADGRALVLYEDPNLTRRSIAEFSEADAETYEDLYAEWNQLAYDIQRPEWYNPPRPWVDRRAEFERSAKGRRYLELLERAPIEVLRERFESEHVRGLFAFLVQATGAHAFEQGIDGSLVRAFNGNHFLQVARGGTGTYGAALAACLEDAGGKLFTEARVTSISVADGAIDGVELADGREVDADVVVSNVHYPQTYLDLVGRQALTESFVAEVENEYELMEGALFGAHLALEEAPNFSAAEHNPDLNRTVKFTAGLETPEDLLREKEAIGSGRLPDDPPLAAGALTVLDPSQAPAGKHTAYLWTHTPWDLADGGPEAWDDVKDEFMATCIDQLAEYAPNIGEEDVIIDRYAYSPLDVQRTHRNMLEGSRSGGSYAPDRVMENRPAYRGPIEGLYLSGSPVHPGGSVTGAPGYNCAGVVVEDLGLERWWEPPTVAL